jgi:membrane protease YdiL (CAAX protease family)
MTRQTASAIALACLLPVPSLGTYLGMVALAGTPAGKMLFFAAKIWVVAVPLVWAGASGTGGMLRQALVNRRGLVPGIVVGVTISALIIATYVLLGRRLLSPDHMQQMATRVGLTTPTVYLTGAAYWVLVNAPLEELVYRWFVIRAASTLGWGRWAILLSAAAFVLHHVVAMAVYCSPVAVGIICAGIFTGGLIWALMMRRFDSLPAVTVSHAIVDICVFALGYHILFGST